jgi:hypothetical protein
LAHPVSKEPRRINRVDVHDATSHDGRLRFRVHEEVFEIVLGDDAPRWARALATPPPTVLEKLGLRAGVSAYPLGLVPDLLQQDLAAHLAGDVADAEMVIAVVTDQAELQALPEWMQRNARGVPVWVVHGKGASSAPSANDVRVLMRANGFRDAKICAIGGTW